MNSITQLMKYRRSMVEYALKHGVTKTAIKYKTFGDNRYFSLFPLLLVRR